MVEGEGEIGLGRGGRGVMGDRSATETGLGDGGIVWVV